MGNSSKQPRVNLANPREGFKNAERIALDTLERPECKEVLDRVNFIMDLDESELEEQIRECLQGSNANSRLVAEHFKDCKDRSVFKDESFYANIAHQVKILDLSEFRDEDKLATEILFMVLDKEYKEIYSGEEFFMKRTAIMRFSTSFAIIGTSLQLGEIIRSTPPDKLMDTFYLHKLYYFGFLLGMLETINILYPDNIDIGGSAYH